MITNKPLVLLIAFTGLMAAVYSMAKTYTPQPVEWVTIHLPDPPKPLADPESTLTALPLLSGLAELSSPNQNEGN